MNVSDLGVYLCNLFIQYLWVYLLPRINLAYYLIYYMQCKKVYYCSKSCQQEDWTEHKKECKKLRDAKVQ